MDGKDSAIGPIKCEQSLSIFLREIALRSELNAGRRADADVNHGRQTVGVIFRPFGGTRAPAVLARGNTMNDSRRPIPRQAPVPFHVAVKAEDFPIRTEIEIISISKSSQKQLPFLSFGIS